MCVRTVCISGLDRWHLELLQTTDTAQRSCSKLDLLSLTVLMSTKDCNDLQNTK